MAVYKEAVEHLKCRRVFCAVSTYTWMKEEPSWLRDYLDVTHCSLLSWIPEELFLFPSHVLFCPTVFLVGDVILRASNLCLRW